MEEPLRKKNLPAKEKDLWKKKRKNGGDRG